MGIKSQIKGVRQLITQGRNREIKRLAMEGRLSLVEIGKLFNGPSGQPLSRQRIHQIAFGRKAKKGKTYGSSTSKDSGVG